MQFQCRVCLVVVVVLRKSLHSTILALNLLHESYYFYRVPHHIGVGKRNATTTTKKKYTKNVNVYFALDCICTGKKYNKDKNKCKEGRVIANLKQSAYINKLEETQTKLG